MLLGNGRYFPTPDTPYLCCRAPRKAEQYSIVCVYLVEGSVFRGWWSVSFFGGRCEVWEARSANANWALGVTK